MIRRRRLAAWVCAALVGLAAGAAGAQTRPAPKAELRLRVVSSLPGKPRPVPAVIWLDPLAGTPALSFPPARHYALLQKNRIFIPHLLVIPVGSAVAFPNDDPFFHNVFSLFEGKRFDLGLYEAGSEKSVIFSRSGVSYIFCNIHPEMSAVIIALRTPLYAIAGAHPEGRGDDRGDRRDDRRGDKRHAVASFLLGGIPAGDYELHVWIEGVPQSFLDRLDRRVRVADGTLDLGVVQAPIADARTVAHTDLYGRDYATDSPSDDSEY